MEFDQFCDEVLSLIEYEENSLLNWGFTEAEVDLVIQLPRLLDKLTDLLRNVWEDFQENDGLTEDDIRENLLQRRLIFIIDGGLYRSRFAETMRLLLLLRQRFDYSDWATAPRLVSDARIQLQRRRYPKRDIPYRTFIESLSDLQLTPAHRKTLDILLQGADGNHYNWAGFQQRATHEILRQLNRHVQSGVIIGAGTGSGKTKAAYIPALTWLDNRITNQHRVSIIAIYPRNELLKDQFVEAIRETERLNAERREQGKRSIVLGAFYGDTPHTSTDKFVFKEDQDWDVAFMRCPECNGTLIWSAVDRGEKKHLLRCQTCPYESKPDHILVTRIQMRDTPPDILFTTTEMLNRNMSQTEQWVVFGIQQSPPPEMLLLDEVHTYEGVSGANVAYLIRRWRHACEYGIKKHTLCVVGLSATLSQATETFAKLIGLSSKDVRYISPNEESEENNEIDTEGIEYNVILKGDPSSGTALLSTSIQTAMLLSRTLSPITDQSTKSNTYPPKIFAFVNRLDTLNRWFDNQIDVEKKLLSRYRDWGLRTPSPTPTESRAIKLSGQDWRITKLIGHHLDQPIEIDRTSSQSPGVVDRAKLVIATSALEVGFNDHRVGAVIQHQSPITIASFMQRKGRAGRNRRTRPWTVVVVSAYGRDRTTFQNAERLFDTLLPPINLPTQNYYVQKIQAAYVLMDWLTQRLHNQFPDLNVWKLLYTGKPPRVNVVVRNLLQQLLTDSTMIADYENYLRRALVMTGSEFDNTIHNLLWGEPRPILREVVPTLLRQLESNWQIVTPDGDTKVVQRNIPPPEKPLPEFVPSTLFFDLNLPELALYLGDRDEKPRQEPFLQAFEEIVPGRVSKRYLPHGRYGANGFWVEVPNDNSNHTYDLTALSIEFESNQLPLTLNADGKIYQIRRPINYLLTSVPSNVSSSSTAWPIWRSELTPKGLTGEVTEGHILTLGKHSLWHKFVKEMRMYTHVLSTIVVVKRGMIGVQITHRRNTERIFGNRFFIEQGALSGIGYSVDVDGLCIQYQPLDQVALRQSPEWETLLHLTRPQLFAYLLQDDHDLTERFNLSPFEIEWIWQVSLAGLVTRAIGTEQSLSDAHEFLSTHFMSVIERVMDAIFQSVSDDDENADRGTMVDGLLDRFCQLPIQQIVLRHMPVLWEADPPQLAEWLNLQYASSLACTLFSTLTTIVSDINPMDLNLDVIYPEHQIWITESTPGGVGLIARIAEAVTHYPRRLALQLNDSIRHCERAQRADALNTVIKELLQHPNGTLSQAFSSIRDRRDFVSVSAAKQQLNAALFSEHLPPTRELVVALNAKMLRPNSTVDTDHLTHDLVDTWAREQHRLGIDVGLRVFAVAILNRDVIREQMDSILNDWGYTERVSDSQRVNLVESMLWQSCHDSCEECINHKPRYQSLVKPSRLMLRALIPNGDQVVDYHENEWRFNLVQQLQERNEGTLRCRYDEIIDVKSDMMALLTEPVEIGVQIFYPILEAVEREGDFWLLHIIVREMVGI